MTKQDLQKELLEKVKPGTKPSHLKRSKSLSELQSNERHIPKAPPLPKSEVEQLKKENSQLQEQLTQAQAENQTTLARLKELHEFAKTSPKTPPSPYLTELDQSLEARHQGLKTWFKQYQKTQNLDQELTDNVEQASAELIHQEQKISSLRTQNNQLKQENQNLHRELKLVQGLAELRRTSPFFTPDPNPLNYLKYTLYSLLALWLVIGLIKTRPNQDPDLE